MGLVKSQDSRLKSQDSIPRLRRIDLVDPFHNPAAQVLHLEAYGLEIFRRPGAAGAHLALRDDFAVAGKLLIPSRQFAEWYQGRSRDAIDLVLVRLAHVENEKVVTGVKAALQLNGC